MKFLYGLPVLAFALSVWGANVANAIVVVTYPPDPFIELCRTGTAQQVEDAIKVGANPCSFIA